MWSVWVGRKFTPNQFFISYKSWILNTFKDPEDMIVKVNLSSAKKERKMIQIFSQKEL